MIFTSLNSELGKCGGGKVWHGGRTVAVFNESDFFETTDKSVIAVLKKRGFKSIDKDEKPKDEKQEPVGPINKSKPTEK